MTKKQIRPRLSPEEYEFIQQRKNNQTSNILVIGDIYLS